MFKDKAVRIVVSILLAPGHLSSCLQSERYMYRLFAFVQNDRKYPSAVVLRYVTPFQFTDIIAVKGKEISVLDRIVAINRFSSSMVR